MKINRYQLQEGKKEVFEENIDFSSYPFNDTHVRGIPSCHVKLELTDFGEILQAIFHIVADVTAVCSYTLEDVPMHIKIDDELDFSDTVMEDDSIIYEGNNIIDFDPHILSLILAKIPIKVVKKGAKLPQNGDGYSVMSEEEYFAKKANQKDSRWDILDTVKLDDSDK